MAQALRKMSRSADRSIRRRMFGPQSPDFTEIEEEPVLGMVEIDSDPFAAEYLDRFGPLRRLLAEEEERWIGINIPQYKARAMAHRRKLMSEYADTIADDIELLWAGKRQRARTETWQFVPMILWRAESISLVGQLRAAAVLHYLGTRQAQRLANRAINELEAFIAAAVLETRRPLPTAGL